MSRAHAVHATTSVIVIGQKGEVEQQGIHRAIVGHGQCVLTVKLEHHAVAIVSQEVPEGGFRL